MNRLRYGLVAAIPLIAVWFFVLGQSTASLRDLLAGWPGAERQPTARSAAAPAAATEQSASQITRAPREEVARTAPLVVHADPAPEQGQVADRGQPGEGLAAEPLPHPEITDPKIRALLQPAWDD